MRKDELISLVEELIALESLDDRADDIYFIKKEYIRLNNGDEETYFEKVQTDKFNKAYLILANKVPELTRSSLEDKKELIAKAKALIEAKKDIKNLNKQINDLYNDFRKLPKCGKEQDDEMFAEFKALKDKANEIVNSYYEGIKSTFNDRKAKKEELIAKAKEVLGMENIKNATASMDALMDEWKTVGFAGKEVDQALWEEFNEVRKEFSAKRKAHFENMKQVYEERANAKETLIKKVKYITSEAYFTDEEIKEIKDIEKEFRNIGFAGKEKDQELWDAMQAAVKKYFEEMKFYK